MLIDVPNKGNQLDNKDMKLFGNMLQTNDYVAEQSIIGVSMLNILRLRHCLCASARLDFLVVSIEYLTT